MGDGERIVVDPKSTLWQARFGKKGALREIYRRQRGCDLLGEIDRVRYTGSTITLFMTDGSTHELRNEETDANE